MRVEVLLYLSFLKGSGQDLGFNGDATLSYLAQLRECPKSQIT